MIPTFSVEQFLQSEMGGSSSKTKLAHVQIEELTVPIVCRYATLPLESFAQQDLARRMVKEFSQSLDDHDDNQDADSVLNASEIVDDVSETASTCGNASSLSFRSNFDTSSKMSPVPSSILSEGSSKKKIEVISGKKKGRITVNTDAYPVLKEKLGEKKNLQDIILAGIDEQRSKDFNIDCRFRKQRHRWLFIVHSCSDKDSKKQMGVVENNIPSICGVDPQKDGVPQTHRTWMWGMRCNQTHCSNSTKNLFKQGRSCLESCSPRQMLFFFQFDKGLSTCVYLPRHQSKLEIASNLDLSAFVSSSIHAFGAVSDFLVKVRKGGITTNPEVRQILRQITAADRPAEALLWNQQKSERQHGPFDNASFSSQSFNCQWALRRSCRSFKRTWCEIRWRWERTNNNCDVDSVNVQNEDVWCFQFQYEVSSDFKEFWQGWRRRDVAVHSSSWNSVSADARFSRRLPDDIREVRKPKGGNSSQQHVNFASFSSQPPRVHKEEDTFQHFDSSKLDTWRVYQSGDKKEIEKGLDEIEQCNKAKRESTVSERRLLWRIHRNCILQSPRSEVKRGKEQQSKRFYSHEE